MNKPKGNAAVAMVVVIIAAACFLISHSGFYLTVRDRDTNKIYSKYRLDDGDRFSVTFIHSVNKTPVTDIYEIEDKHIFVEECLYYGFGAGVQSQLNPGEVLTSTDDGGMLISNIHQNRDNVGYIVGTVSDHILTIDDEEISLRDMCGKNTAIRINYEFVL